MKIMIIRETVRVVMNLNGGFTKVITDSVDDGTNLVEPVEHEVSTASIPEVLRKPASRFVIVRTVPIPSPTDDLTSIKKADKIVAIEGSHLCRSPNQVCRQEDLSGSK